MPLRFGRALCAATLMLGTLLVLADCSKSATAPAVVATATPSTSITFTVVATGSAQTLPTGLGYSGSLTFPAATTGAGASFTVAESGLVPPAGVAALTNPNVGLLYYTFTASTNVTFAGYPATSITLPSTISTSGSTFYLGYYNPTTASWQLAFAGPGTVSGQTISFPAGGTAFSMTANTAYNYALYALTSTGPTPTPTPVTKFMYVTNAAPGNPNRNSISIFPATSNGNVLPVGALAGANTLLNLPNGLAFDSAAKLYVANGGGSITEYASPGSGGNIAPSAVITGPLTGLVSPLFDALDGAGNLYVTQNGINSVEVFAAGASGNVAPVQTIVGPATGLNNPYGVAVDAAGNIYVANNGGNSVTKYAAGATGNVAPVATLAGATTTIAAPTGLALDSAGDIIVATAGGSILTFKAGATGNVAPATTVSGSNTLLNSPMELSLDLFGLEYVANNGAAGVGANAALVFPPTATGNMAPAQFVSGPSTGLAQPFGIAAR